MKGCNSGIKKGDLERSDFQMLRLCNLRLLYLVIYTVEFVFACVCGYVYVSCVFCFLKWRLLFDDTHFVLC